MKPTELIFSENESRNSIEIRCPGKFKKLFLILLQEHMPQQGMLMEIACADCAKEFRKIDPTIKRALHYYDTAGICVHTKLVGQE